MATVNTGQFVRGQRAWNRDVDMRHKDLTGHRYGRWVVLRADGKKRYTGCVEYFWLCRCDCGTERVVKGASLRTNRSQSCGCLATEKRKATVHANDMAIKRRLFRECQRRASQYDRTFSLSFEEFVVLLGQNCRYCGDRPTNRSTSDYTSPNFRYSGIDRIDNAGGYTSDNVAACCKTCNGMKSAMSETEFREQVVKIFNHYGGKG